MVTIEAGAESRNGKHEATIQPKIGSIVEELMGSLPDVMIKRVLAWEIR